MVFEDIGFVICLIVLFLFYSKWFLIIRKGFYLLVMYIRILSNYSYWIIDKLIIIILDNNFIISGIEGFLE